MTDAIFQQVCRVTANGGTPVTVAEDHQLHYGELMAWIRSDPARETRYLQACQDRAEWGREAVLKEMRALAFVRASHVFHDDGSVKPPSQWPQDLAQTISSLDVSETLTPCPECHAKIPSTVKKLRFWDKTKALEMMAKNLNLLNVKLDVHHTNDLATLIAQAWDPEAATALPPKHTELTAPGGINELGPRIGAEAKITP